MAIYKTLEELRAEKYANNKAAQSGYFSHVYKVKPPKSAAQLETLITEYIQLSGGICTKINILARQLTTKTFVVDVVGRKNSITNTAHIPSSTKSGTSDLIASIPNVVGAVYIEVKFSKGDRLRDTQIAFKKDVESKGFKYLIAKKLDDVYHLFE